eukprot:TRINITY_DN6631_c0_g1_i2.p1 TRINITY_DN6631_c0_g1~~TRINITY_DN6631_c0_g1_i2.p1  ORF type:complete len:871 (+),score=145.36 TRINITY_DN6631_c0_g1_i2:349-2961(+)
MIRGLSRFFKKLRKLIYHGGLTSISELIMGCLMDNESEDQIDNVWSQLNWLDCSQNGISCMDNSFKHLPVLQYLNLSQNQIEKICYIEDCYQLQRLDLSFNRITTVEDIYMLVGCITELNLCGNQLSSTDGLDRLLGLKVLNISCNTIHDFYELERLSKLPFLNNLSVSGNPISAHPQYRMEILSIFADKRNCFILDEQPVSPQEESYMAAMAHKIRRKHSLGRPRLAEIVEFNPDKSPKLLSPTGPSVAATDLAARLEQLRYESGNSWLLVYNQMDDPSTDGNDSDKGLSANDDRHRDARTNAISASLDLYTIDEYATQFHIHDSHNVPGTIVFSGEQILEFDSETRKCRMTRELSKVLNAYPDPNQPRVAVVEYILQEDGVSRTGSIKIETVKYSLLHERSVTQICRMLLPHTHDRADEMSPTLMPASSAKSLSPSHLAPTLAIGSLERQTPTRYAISKPLDTLSTSPSPASPVITVSKAVTKAISVPISQVQAFKHADSEVLSVAKQQSDQSKESLDARPISIQDESVDEQPSDSVEESQSYTKDKSLQAESRHSRVESLGTIPLIFDASTSTKVNNEERMDAKMDAFFRREILKGRVEPVKHYLPCSYIKYGAKQVEERLAHACWMDGALHVIKEKKGAPGYEIGFSFSPNQIKRLGIGTAGQILRVETGSGTHVLLVRDKTRTEKTLDFVNSVWMGPNKSPPGFDIYFYDMESQSLLLEILEDIEGDDAVSNFYLMIFLVHDKEDETTCPCRHDTRPTVPRSIVVSEERLYLFLDDYIRWPLLPGMPIPNTPEFKCEKWVMLREITQLEMFSDTGCEVFFESEEDGMEFTWQLICGSSASRQSLVHAISSKWKQLFKVELRVVHR